MSRLSTLSEQSTAQGEVPEFIIPSLNNKGKTQLSDLSLYSSLISSCSSGNPFLDASPLPPSRKRSPTPRIRQSLACTSTFVKVDQPVPWRLSEQIKPTSLVPLLQRSKELFPFCSSPALRVKRKSRPSLDTSNYGFHIASAFPSMSLVHEEEASTTELQSSSTSTSDLDSAFEDAISISATYNARNKGLQFSIHDLCCGVPTVGYTKDSYLVELTLNPGKHRHLLRNIYFPPNDSDDNILLPPKKVAFKGVRSTSLSSKILTIKVYANALIRRTGKLLYEASIPLADVSLTGDAHWVALKPTAQQKTASSISFCMCYNARKKKLMITVVNAKSLKMPALRKVSYVEVKLFRRDSAESEAMKTIRTKYHRGGSNPVYKEAFSLDFTTDGSDASRYAELTFTVRRKGFLQADMVLGKVTLSSDLQLRWKKFESLKNTLDEVFRYPGKVITQTHNLSAFS